CRLFPFWDRLLRTAGYDIVVVSPIRPPWEVAASLASRNGMSKPSAFRLWMRHVLEAERMSRGLHRQFILWPHFLNSWAADLTALARSAGLALDLGETNSAKIAAHLTADLHRQSTIAPAPSEVMKTYRLLVQNAI